MLVAAFPADVFVGDREVAQRRSNLAQSKRAVPPLPNAAIAHIGRVVRLPIAAWFSQVLSSGHVLD